MNNFKEKMSRLGYNMRRGLANFMVGRYGPDRLYRFLIALALAVALVNIAFNSWVVSVISYIILLYAVWRTLSRNGTARARENMIYMGLTAKIRAWFGLTARRVREFKTHRFRHCPHCHCVLRLPAQRGTHSVTCPRCGKDFTTHIL